MKSAFLVGLVFVLATSVEAFTTRMSLPFTYNGSHDVSNGARVKDLGTKHLHLLPPPCPSSLWTRKSALLKVLANSVVRLCSFIVLPLTVNN